MKLIGIPFKDFGRDEKGLDCFGLVLYYYKHFLNKKVKDFFYDDLLSINVKDILKIQDQWDVINNIKDIKKNDVLLIDSILASTHILIYIGDNQILHCNYKIGVCIEDFKKYSTRINKILRFKG